MVEKGKIYNEDCLEIMKDIPDKSIDMILCDLPYGTTACSWDIIIPFEPLWSAYKRIIKDNGAIVLTASQPFTSKLVMSNLDMFKYELIWEKEQGTNQNLCNIMPLKKHENILVFCKGKTIYNPQMGLGNAYVVKRKNKIELDPITSNKQRRIDTINKGNRYPVSIIKKSRELKDRYHPTQKPVKLFEYLIKTYTNEGDIVLDNCAGSFTTAVAAIKTGRNWICIEKEEKYCKIGAERIKEATRQGDFFINIHSPDSVFDLIK
jgi:site-specific DNA-methyltransferase (adenine-specific)